MYPRVQIILLRNPASKGNPTFWGIPLKSLLRNPSDVGRMSGSHLSGYYAKKEGVKKMIYIKPPAELAKLSTRAGPSEDARPVAKKAVTKAHYFSKWNLFGARTLVAHLCTADIMPSSELQHFFGFANSVKIRQY
ncbi:hypothetical protein DFH08DRAFT_807024 [Mycena albidolilacea]|uniref:Uncharacterized protein n=1 Tax=Mycena albidolilacea TaxID=1033008 RepID=A0AAD7A511_9AGAR|nr:hypothetical protein DFH08DRAFT_807024 [Mycena albidolilacea]